MDRSRTDDSGRSYSSRRTNRSSQVVIRFKPGLSQHSPRSSESSSICSEHDSKSISPKFLQFLREDSLISTWTMREDSGVSKYYRDELSIPSNEDKLLTKLYQSSIFYQYMDGLRDLFSQKVTAELVSQFFKRWSEPNKASNTKDRGHHIRSEYQRQQEIEDGVAKIFHHIYQARHIRIPSSGKIPGMSRVIRFFDMEYLYKVYYGPKGFSLLDTQCHVFYENLHVQWKLSPEIPVINKFDGQEDYSPYPEPLKIRSQDNHPVRRIKHTPRVNVLKDCDAVDYRPNANHARKINGFVCLDSANEYQAQTRDLDNKNPLGTAGLCKSSSSDHERESLNRHQNGSMSQGMMILEQISSIERMNGADFYDGDSSPELGGNHAVNSAMVNGMADGQGFRLGSLLISTRNGFLSWMSLSEEQQIKSLDAMRDYLHQQTGRPEFRHPFDISYDDDSDYLTDSGSDCNSDYNPSDISGDTSRNDSDDANDPSDVSCLDSDCPDSVDNLDNLDNLDDLDSDFLLHMVPIIGQVSHISGISNYIPTPSASPLPDRREIHSTDHTTYHSTDHSTDHTTEHVTDHVTDHATNSVANLITMEGLYYNPNDPQYNESGDYSDLEVSQLNHIAKSSIAKSSIAKSSVDHKIDVVGKDFIKELYNINQPLIGLRSI